MIDMRTTTGSEAPGGASMKTTLAALVRQLEDDQVIEACRALRLDADEAAGVLARHRANRSLLALVVAHGGTAADFVEGRLEIRRAIRSSGG
jgi:hypothetical protein